MRSKGVGRQVFAWLFVISGSALLIASLLQSSRSQIWEPLPVSESPATQTPEPIVPTATRAPEAGSMATEDEPGASPSPTLVASLPKRGSRLWVLPTERWRLGVSLPGSVETPYDLEALRVGWVMDWQVRIATPIDHVVDYAQTVRMEGGLITPDRATLSKVAVARPGSLWLISNEPDVRWQDNVPPDVYARLYHEAYHAIKRGDPDAIVAAGGIAQPTPLRLRYLEAVLRDYHALYGAPMPVDAWHIHNYMLREERDSWGVDIPPGFTEEVGRLYEIEDSANLEAFEAQVFAFRRWMADHGYGGLPLYVSEYGIPMPEDYGFPSEVVIDFLEGAWRFFLSASNPTLGVAADEGRLVQAWCWFSMASMAYPTGNLVDPVSGAWTELGNAWQEMVRD